MRSEGYNTWSVCLCVCLVCVCVCVCVSTTILGLQATRRLMSDNNNFSATRARRKKGDFTDMTAFERYGVKNKQYAI